jgi:hypothetical protein
VKPLIAFLYRSASATNLQTRRLDACTALPAPARVGGRDRDPQAHCVRHRRRSGFRKSLAWIFRHPSTFASVLTHRRPGVRFACRSSSANRRQKATLLRAARSWPLSTMRGRPAAAARAERG